MRTPIYDFVQCYIQSNTVRFHMPGHKGKSFLGCESMDITEIGGADVLYAPDGIIAESEANATRLFDTAHTFYSTEGSSLAIRAMLALVVGGHGVVLGIGFLTGTLVCDSTGKTDLFAQALCKNSTG